MKPHQKLSDAEVRLIRERFPRSTIKELAFDFHVSRPHIQRIVKRETRKDVR